MSDAPATRPQITSYASPARQSGYIAAMRRIAAERKPGTPVRVFLTAPPGMRHNSEVWPKRLRRIDAELPMGVDLLYYGHGFEMEHRSDYPKRWEALVPELDGLVVSGKLKHHLGYVYLLGPVARNELRAVVATGKPVLLDTREGLVPVVDCKPQRMGPDEQPQLKLTVPRNWETGPRTTLRAALDALRPAQPPAPLVSPFLAGAAVIPRAQQQMAHR